MSRLLMYGTICLDVHYDVMLPNPMHTDAVLSVYVESRYSDVTADVYTKHLIRKSYTTNLQEFPGEL